ncbi:MAG: adenylate/guanylate cyclase domain-containing protein, partial [Elstera sp.]
MRWAVLGRAAVVVLLCLYFIVLGTYPSNLYSALICAAFLAVGLWQFQRLRTGRDRPWHAYLGLTLDGLGLALLALFGPLALTGGVPQIMLFRAYGVTHLFVFPAVAALSLSPRLVLWAGGVALGVLWGVWGVIVSGMARRVSWVDFPQGGSAEEYIAVISDPDFIGTANRAMESLALLAVTVLLAVAVRRVRRLVAERAVAERARARVASIFGRYVPPAVAARAMGQEVSVSGVRREVSFLFTDIAGFTTLSEQAEPEQVVAVLNDYFDGLCACIGEEGGIVVDFIGDAVFALFGAPDPLDNHAAAALRAACRIDAFAESFRRTAALSLGETRLAVHTGTAVVGNLGAVSRLKYGAAGDAVNTAARLEKLNKDFGTRLIASAEAVTAAQW